MKIIYVLRVAVPKVLENASNKDDVAYACSDLRVRD